MKSHIYIYICSRRWIGVGYSVGNGGGGEGEHSPKPYIFIISIQQTLLRNHPSAQRFAATIISVSIVCMKMVPTAAAAVPLHIAVEQSRPHEIHLEIPLRRLPRRQHLVPEIVLPRPAVDHQPPPELELVDYLNANSCISISWKHCNNNSNDCAKNFDVQSFHGGHACMINFKVLVIDIRSFYIYSRVFCVFVNMGLKEQRRWSSYFSFCYLLLQQTQRKCLFVILQHVLLPPCKLLLSQLCAFF